MAATAASPAFDEGDIVMNDVESYSSWLRRPRTALSNSECHFNRRTNVRLRTAPRTLAVMRLSDHFARLLHPNASPADAFMQSLHSWPFAIVHGPPSCGKTSTALQYSTEKENEYGPIIWINATNRRSIELSFRDVARQIMSQTPANQLQELEDIPIQGHDELSGSQLRRLVDIVTERLEQPQEKTWLLILDDLSQSSTYPVPTALTGQFDPSPTKKQTWPELLRLIPCASARNGRIIITTREDPDVPDVAKMLLESPREETVKYGTTAGSEEQEHMPRVASWWKGASSEERGSFGVGLFLADADQPWVAPLTLPFQPSSRKGVRGRKGQKDSRFSKYVLGRGPSLLRELGESDKSVADVALAAWKTVSDQLSEAGTDSDLINRWTLELQVVGSCRTVLKRCEDLVDQQCFTEDILWSRGDIRWGHLGSMCEQHSAYLVAGKFYYFARQLIAPSQVASMNGISLHLDYARMLWYNGNQELVEKQLVRILEQTQGPVECGEEWALCVRVAVCRQLAALRASQGRFRDAASELSQALELDDPFSAMEVRGDFGRVATQLQDAVIELASYLVSGGLRASAAAVLYRCLAEQERIPDQDHPATLAMMEATATALQQLGQLADAETLFRRAWKGHCVWLHGAHPVVLLCRARLAAALDMQGHRVKAEEAYRACLKDAISGPVKPHHPVLFGLRENYAICLAQQRKQVEAETELRRLMEELTASGGLYPSSTRRRVESLLNAVIKEDKFTINRARRNTLGLREFENYGRFREGLVSF